MGRTQIMRNIKAYQNNTGKAKVRNTLAKGARMDATNVHGRTPLFYLFLKTGGEDLPYISDDLVREFISKGANINVRDDKGNTPLHIACEHHRIMTPTIDILLKAGADPSLVNKHGCTPLLTMLLHRPTTVQIAALALIQKMSEAALNVQDITGNTALHYAIQDEFTTIIDKLLDSGVDVNLKNNYGQTPIYMAIENNDLGSVRKLLAERASIQIKDTGRYTPLDYAKRTVPMIAAKKRMARGRNAKNEAEIALVNATEIEKLLEEEMNYLDTRGINNININQYNNMNTVYRY